MAEKGADAEELCLARGAGVLLVRQLLRELIEIGRRDVSIVVHRVDALTARFRMSRDAEVLRTTKERGSPPVGIGGQHAIADAVCLRGLVVKCSKPPPPATRRLMTDEQTPGRVDPDQFLHDQRIKQAHVQVHQLGPPVIVRTLVIGYDEEWNERERTRFTKDGRILRSSGGGPAVFQEDTTRGLRKG